MEAPAPRAPAGFRTPAGRRGGPRGRGQTKQKVSHDGAPFRRRSAVGWGGRPRRAARVPGRGRAGASLCVAADTHRPLVSRCYQCASAGTISPPARVISAARTRMSMPAFKKCTEPSANTKLAPPGWKLYTCRSLVQFMAQGLRGGGASGLAPLGVTRFDDEAQAPPVL